MISIWFFIGFSLAVNGALILGAGIYQIINPPLHPEVVLFSMHANAWWGGVLFLIGLVYCFWYWPGREHSKSAAEHEGR
jgi:hypothetical protein